MEQSLPRCRDILFCSEFKKAMLELCKNKGLSFAQAEKSMGLKDGFIESVEKGIYKLTLEDVRKIAGYFRTTMDSVLDGGKVECRVYIPGLTVTHLFLMYGTLRASTLLPTVFTLKGINLEPRGVVIGIMSAMAVGLPVFGYGNIKGIAAYKTAGSLLTVLLSGVLALMISRRRGVRNG